MKKLYDPRYPTMILALTVSLAAGSASASQIVVVTPTPGNPVQSGNDLIAAHNAITGNLWGRRYLVLLEPGVYDLGNQNIQMKDYVDIAGSGRESTFVYGYGNRGDQLFPRDRGLFQGARFNELRDLTIRVFESVERPILIPIYLGRVGPAPGPVTPSTTRVRNVRTQAFGTADYCTGIEGRATSSVIEDVQILVACSGHSTGVVFAGFVPSDQPAPKVRRVELIANTFGFGTSSTGILVEHVDSGYPGITIEDSNVIASGGTASGLIHRNAVGSSSRTLTVTDTTFIARGTGANTAASLETEISSTTFRHSRLYAEPGTSSVGVLSSGVVSIENSLVSGPTRTVLGGGVSVRVGNSQLHGGPASGAVICAGVYDENFTFFASTCP